MNYKEHLKHITTFIFDYDGVISDGKVWVIDERDQIRNSTVKDGYALHHAVKKGYRIAIISGGKGDSMRIRLNNLGITDVFQAVRNKLEIFREYCAEHNIDPKNVLYMGDDIPDYMLMKHVGIATCPADAVPEIKDIAHYISHQKGGEGCVRDVIEQVLKVRGDWMDDEAFTW
ncbi:MAG: HAD hydrolase family protein [Bacteroidales bacterium]|jgi:3-deoxy-D-manno-octulosonate 8-phosphate phosphatase (KDO 8-P phosphatase)|nr:HAD hydrolase family protein [Bacteroidales bacterium]